MSAEVTPGMAGPEFSFSGWGLELLGDLDHAERISRNALVIAACRRGLVGRGLGEGRIGDAFVLPAGVYSDRPWTYDVHVVVDGRLRWVQFEVSVEEINAWYLLIEAFDVAVEALLEAFVARPGEDCAVWTDQPEGLVNLEISGRSDPWRISGIPASIPDVISAIQAHPRSE